MRPARERLKGIFGGSGSAPGGSSRPPLSGSRKDYPLLEEKVFSGSRLHGEVRIDAALSASFQALAVLAGDPALAGLDPREALFLDTETTGLAGGAGTLVFLCGTARFREDGSLLFRRWFLGSPGGERAFLEGILGDLEQVCVLVTFSGKSFDRHRLADRLAFHGMDEAVRRMLHLDLLHSARRVYKKLLPDVRLRTLEERVLGIAREDDLPGSECPRLYLDWLRGHAVDLEPVFRHNEWDVLTLVVLLAGLGRDPWAGPVPLPLLRAHAARLEKAEPLRAARLYERAGRDLERALCLARGGESAEAGTILEMLARMGEREALLPLARLLAGSSGERERALEAAREAFRSYLPGEKGRDEAARLLRRLGGTERSG